MKHTQNQEEFRLKLTRIRQQQEQKTQISTGELKNLDYLHLKLEQLSKEREESLSDPKHWICVDYGDLSIMS